MNASHSWKAFGIVLGFIVFVASLNIIVQRLIPPVRFDTTEGNVFTLSDGTRAILNKARESERPVTIRLYVSGEDAQLPKEFTEYAKRVEDLLQEFAKASGNSIVVQSYSPVPNSVEEDSAVLDGINARDPLMDLQQTESLDDIDFNRRGRGRQSYFFGLSVSSLQKIETIPFLDPKQEADLEYQLTRAIASVTRKKRLKIGLLEGNEIGLAGQPGIMGGRASPPWTIYRYLSKDFDIVPVPFDVKPMKPGDKDHPFYNLDLLLIVHPVRINRPQSPRPGMPPMGATTIDELSKESQYAIDQFVVGGGKAIAFLDNQYMVSRYFDPYSAVLPFQRRDENPSWLKDLMNLFDSQALPSYRSGLDELYKSWGVKVGGPGTKNPVLIDPKYSRAVSYPRPVQQILQREFRLVNQIRQIPDRRWTQAVVQAMERGAAIMADFSDDALTKDDPVTRNLSSVRMVDPSPIEGNPAGGLKMRTLVRSSPKSKALAGRDVGFTLGISRTLEEAMAQLQSQKSKEARYPVAVVLEGKFKSAFESDPGKEPEEVEEPEPAPPVPTPPAPPVNPPLLPRDAPDSVPEPAPAPTPPAEPPPAPAPSAPEPPAAGEDDPTPAEPKSGDPPEGEFPNPQNPEKPETPPADVPPADSPDAAPPAAAQAAAEEPAEEKPAPPKEDDPAAAADPPKEEKKEGDDPDKKEGDDPDKNAGDAADKKEEEEDYHLAAGDKPGAVAIVSDVDMLFDFFLGDPNSRGGQRSHDNLAFVFNLIETLAGDQDLVAVRGRGSTHRPFTVINDIRKKAGDKQATKRADIQDKMEEANKALMDGQLVLTQEGNIQIQMDAERAEKLELAQAEIRELEQQQRLINREERQEIQFFIGLYKWMNMLIAPTFVVLVGFIVGITRHIKTAAR